jgi:hypothetical protein
MRWLQIGNHFWLLNVDERKLHNYKLLIDSKFSIRGNEMKEKIFWLPVISAIVAAAVTFSGCTGKQSSDQSAKKTLGTASQQFADTLKKESAAARAAGNNSVADAKAQAAAVEYARLGELLLMPEGFQYADQMFAQALSADPSNAKANLYKSVTEPMMTFKGFIPKVERLITQENDMRGLEKLRQNIKDLNMPELEQFAEQVNSGDQVFESYYDVQRFFREKLLPAVLSAVDHLNRVDATNPIQMNFTPERVLADPVRHEGEYYSSWSQCTNDPVQGWSCTYGGYESSYNDKKLRNIYFIDQHDLKIMKSAMMAIADQIRLSTAYSFKDVEFAVRRLNALAQIRVDAGSRLTARDVTDVLHQYDRLFTLEQDNLLSDIAKSSSQVLTNGIELANLKSALCHNSDRNETNSLITSICIEAKAVDSMQMGLDLLAGPKEVTLGTDEDDGTPIKLIVDITTVLNHPTKDLKSLLPVTFDKVGNPTSYPDPTMGGLFPNGDFIDKMKLIGESKQLHSILRNAHNGVKIVKQHL